MTLTELAREALSCIRCTLTVEYPWRCDEHRVERCTAAELLEAIDDIGGLSLSAPDRELLERLGDAELVMGAPKLEWHRSEPGK